MGKSEVSSATEFMLKKDPEVFLRDWLGAEPWEKQMDIIKSVFIEPETFVPSCQGAGKSWIAARAAMAFLYAYPFSLVITTAPIFFQVKNILWREMALAYYTAKKPLGGDLKATELVVQQGTWYAIGMKSEDTRPEQMTGFHANDMLVIIDEASGFPQPLFEAMQGNVSTGNGHLLAIGNPTRTQGFFYDAAHKNRHLSKVISIQAWDTPNFKENGIDSLEKLMSMPEEEVKNLPLPYPGLMKPHWAYKQVLRYGAESPFVRIRIKAEFVDDDQTTVVPLAWAEEAMYKSDDIEADGPPEAGLDVARYGGDESVLAIRRGRKVTKLNIWQGLSATDLVGRVIIALTEAGIMPGGSEIIKVDADGMGGPIVDMLIERGYNVLGVHAAGTPFNPNRYINRRAEMWWDTREMLDPRDVRRVGLPDDETLLAQLTTPKYKVNSKGQIQIESKDDMRKRGLTSPDRADAVMLAFAQERTETVGLEIATFGEDD